MNFSFLNNLKNWQIFFILAVIIFSLYGQSLFFDFSYLDDSTLILDDFYIISNFSNFFEVFKHDLFYSQQAGAYYYRPLLMVSFMVDAAIGGKDPFIYHLSNILLHLFVVCLLFVFLQRLNYSRLSSFFAALFFAIHPISNNTASWIPGRTETIMSVFILISFIFLIDYLKKYKVKNLVLHLIFFLLALFLKETSVLAPILFVLYIFLVRKDFHFIFNSFLNKNRDGSVAGDYAVEKPREALSRLWIIAIGWLVIFIFWFLLRSQALGGAVINMSFVQTIKSFINNLPGIFFYMGKIFFPFNLSVYPILQDSSFVYGILAILLITLLIFVSRKKICVNKLIFGFAWFILFLIPSFLKPNQKMTLDFTEPRIYLPLIGFIIIFLEIDWSAIFKNNYLRNSLYVLVVILFSIINIFYGRVFTNKISFWENAVKNSPHYPLAHRNLGVMYWLDGRVDEAEKEYRESLKLNFTEPMVHNNLGLIYAKKGDFENAIKEYEAELELNPYYGNALYNMGLAYWNMGRKEDAVKQWKETISANPDYFDAYKALIMFYQEDGKKDLADKLMLELQRRGGS